VTVRQLGSAASPTPVAGVAVPVQIDQVTRFRAMACDVSVRVVGPSAQAPAALERAREVFARVEAACTRFVPTSPLMAANADPDSWHEVPAELFDAVAEAAAAHIETGGAFDPRVLRALQSYGYDRSLPFEAGVVEVAGPSSAAGPPAQPAPSAAGPWQPGLGADGLWLRLGPDPIDLGGIGKGLAVRWAAEQLVGAGRAVLVEAGGDCSAAGAGPDGDGWKVGVEDPLGRHADPLAVLSVTDLACATSSVRVRTWRAAGREVHHLIDPRTGEPGGDGLAAVTVVGSDPARAEVWSKALFLAGTARIEALATARDLAALWVTRDGALTTTPAIDRLVVWRGDRAL
jgi:FAD:protein FMN transferase